MAVDDGIQVVTIEVDRGPSILDIAAFIGDVGVHTHPREVWVTVGNDHIRLSVWQILVYATWPKLGLRLRGVVNRKNINAGYHMCHYEYRFSPDSRRGGVLTVFPRNHCKWEAEHLRPAEGSTYDCPTCGVALPTAQPLA